MQLDLNNVDSIVAWWLVFPERHDSYLDYKLRASPEFTSSISAARRRIAASPEGQAFRALQGRQRHRHQTWDECHDSEESPRELTYGDLAMD